MLRLKDKVALVTGGSKGLGEADVRRFLAEGASVVIGDVDTVAGENLARELGHDAHFVSLDVRSEENFAAVIEGVMAQFGQLDILVNNAGVIELGTPEAVTESDYRFIMAVSVDGTVFGCKHAIPAMRRSGGGSIINMASIASVQGVPFFAAYSAAKGAVEAYTRAVSVYCTTNKLPIRCNSIHPGIFATPMHKLIGEKMAKASVGGPSEVYKERPKNPVGDPDEVALLATFLASDESRYITGQRFVIDNGGVVTPNGTG